MMRINKEDWADKMSKLVMKDWLDERKPPLGELIAIYLRKAYRRGLRRRP